MQGVEVFMATNVIKEMKKFDLLEPLLTLTEKIHHAMLDEGILVQTKEHGGMLEQHVLTLEDREWDTSITHMMHDLGAKFERMIEQ